MIKVVGIDPGLAATGIGVVQGAGSRVTGYAFGSVHTAPTQPFAARLHRIHARVSDILAEESPDLLVVEDVFSLDRYPKSGIHLGKVVGVILLAGYCRGIPMLEIPVREAKQVLTGNGNAGKDQLERAVRDVLRVGHPIRPFHASDALGMALIGLYRHAGAAGSAACRRPAAAPCARHVLTGKAVSGS